MCNIARVSYICNIALTSPILAYFDLIVYLFAPSERACLYLRHFFLFTSFVYLGHLIMLESPYAIEVTVRDLVVPLSV